MKYFILLITFSLSILQFSFANNLSKNVEAVKEKEDKYKSNLDLQKIIADAKERGSNHKSIEGISKYISSNEFAQKQKKYTSSMQEIMGLNKGTLSESETTDPLEDMGDRVVLFVSSSMPVSVLRQYARDLSRVNGVMVMQGFIGGISRIMPTKDWIRKLLVVDTNCDTVGCETLDLNVAFDPERFTRNGIDRVPALIYEKNMDLSAYCKKVETKKANFVVYGDASLKGMLLELNRKLNDSNITTLTRHM